MAPRDFEAGPKQRFSMDGRDGYKAGRDRLLAHVASRHVANPIVLSGDVHRSYVRCRLDREQWRTDFRALPYVTTPGAPIATSASFVVENGVPGAHPA